MPFKSPLPPSWDLPHEIRNRFGEQAGKQRAMECEGHLLLVLHAPPKADENQRTARFYWRKPDGSWQSSESSGGASTVARHLEEYQSLLDKIDRSLDSATLARDYFAVMSHLAPLVRSARNLHVTLQEARTAIDSPELITLRDRAYELERMADLLSEDARNGLDFATAQRAEQQSEASHRMEVAAHRLNLLAAFFFPLATLSSIFGANLVHGLEKFDQPPLAFFIMVGAGLLLGVFLTLFIGGRRSSAIKPAKPDPYSKRV